MILLLLGEKAGMRAHVAFSRRELEFFIRENLPLTKGRGEGEALKLFRICPSLRQSADLQQEIVLISSGLDRLCPTHRFKLVGI